LSVAATGRTLVTVGCRNYLYLAAPQYIVGSCSETRADGPEVGLGDLERENSPGRSILVISGMKTAHHPLAALSPTSSRAPRLHLGDAAQCVRHAKRSPETPDPALLQASQNFRCRFAERLNRIVATPVSGPRH